MYGCDSTHTRSVAFVSVYCCELSDTSSGTAAWPRVRLSFERQSESRGETHTSEPRLSDPASFATYVAFTTHEPQLQAVAHSPHPSKRQR